MPPCLLLTARVAPIGTPDRSAGSRLGEADIWLCRVLKPSRETRAWDRTPLGPKTASWSAAHCAGREGIGKTLAPSGIRRYPRCTGRLNATQPGVICRQPSVHTWIGLPAQAKRRRLATPGFIHKKDVKFPLTPWSYLGKKARSEARIRWRAAQITLIRSVACCCAPQHWRACFALSGAEPRPKSQRPPCHQALRLHPTRAWQGTSFIRVSSWIWIKPSRFAPSR
jgi:hypothetical protein